MKKAQFEHGYILLGDCLPFLESCHDNHFGLVLVDPPYGINENNKKNLSRSRGAISKDYGFFDWDKNRLHADYLHHFQRVSKHQIIFGGNYYADLLPPSKSWVVWDKNNSGDFADCELAWTSHDKAVKKIKCTWNGMIHYNMKFKENRIHPTQKPEPVIEFCIDTYYDGGIVLDPCAGSCTTAVICERKKIPWVCIEKEKKHFDDAVSRLLNLQDCLF